LKETRPLWPPQRGVGLQEPNLGKTNPRVTLFICLRFIFHPLSRTRFVISNANPACSCVYICKFQFRPIHPPLGDYQSSPTRSKVVPYDTGAGSHASCKLAQGKRSQTAARGACNCPAVTSIPPLSPRPAGERADSHAVGMQPCQVGAPLRLQRAQHGGPDPHVMQPARRLLRVSNCTAPRATTAPPRLRNQYRDSRQPCA
jgi:hypothetical protein